MGGCHSASRTKLGVHFLKTLLLSLESIGIHMFLSLFCLPGLNLILLLNKKDKEKLTFDPCFLMKDEIQYHVFVFLCLATINCYTNFIHSSSG